MELWEELLLLRTRVGASEKEVWDRGISAPCRYAGPGTVTGDIHSVCGVCRPPRVDASPFRLPSVGNEGDRDLSIADSGGS